MPILNAVSIQSTPPTTVPAPMTGPSAQFPHAPPLPLPYPSPTSDPQLPEQPNSQRGADSGMVAVVSPCAACKILRRRCVDKCVLAPYFPPTDPHKFAIAHRVFGAANIIKLLQELPESKRADAVSSMVYEANARLRDPVYGCAGTICHLQNQMSELQAELAKTQAEAVTLQSLNSNLSALICMEMGKIGRAAGGATATGNCNSAVVQQQLHMMDTSCFLDASSLGSGWEPLWA